MILNQHIAQVEAAERFEDRDDQSSRSAAFPALKTGIHSGLRARVLVSISNRNTKYLLQQRTYVKLGLPLALSIG